MSSYDVLRGYYALHEEIGAGGFGKVKLATHLLTDQKVAIKIIDKKAIGRDLPRVKTEIDALRSLSHQYISRLYQYIETEEKYFIILEYCSGGEMFDYIIRKRRLEESEARHFFRQLLSAMAYIHSQGYAHRDLKPENLLLTEEVHLKVIDFGLCAKAAGRLETHHLETLCGSPAYAAPELIQGQLYKGNEADVWSMGVLLYALLCGQLPFEDDNMQLLYRKIAKGNYEEPKELTQQSRDLLRGMLQTNPKERITIQEILQHPWVNHKHSHQIKWNTIYDKNVIDEDVAREMAFYHKMSLAQMIEKVKEWRFDYMTATYFLLLQKKRQGAHYALPMPPRVAGASTNESNVLASPTIHASLDNHLDRSGLEEEFETSDGTSTSSGSVEHILRDLPKATRRASANEHDRVRFAKPRSPDREKQISYLNAVLNMESHITGISPKNPKNHQRLLFDSPAVSGAQTTCKSANNTPARQKTRDGEVVPEKENRYYRPGAASVRGPLKVYAEDTGTCRTIYATPCRPPLRGLFSPQKAEAVPRQRARSSDRGTQKTVASVAVGSPASIGSGSNCDGRTPRSSTKTPRLRQRVFTSLERKAERMINLLTPRKMKTDSPQVIRSTKNMVNVSVTSSSSPKRVRQELVNVFEQQNMSFELKGWKISGQKKDATGSMTVELEVVFLENCNTVGIKRKRLNGDAFLYKKVCEKVLQMADLKTT
ncbi:unnamed protein product [Caenorhabditis auriculariae]|uniref:non-specific serine/threonine protein kinase n=1 Tax=Caenorhabditis auriculariae TaxID=2777116 RepID=A0A8S1HF49_9PELO|nr:unnamed protein product [Caenorhabditis auriculariae]